MAIFFIKNRQKNEDGKRMEELREIQATEPIFLIPLIALHQPDDLIQRD
jgi:hypothetical protein